MGNKFLLILAGLLFTTTTGFTASVSPSAISDVSHTVTRNNSVHSLVYLGNIEGKAFFAETEILMDWTAAGELCASSRLELAEIESKAEGDFVKSAMAGIASNWYWTAARERRSLDGFVWNGTSTVPNTSSGLSWDGMWDDEFNYNYCGVVAIRDLRFRATLCIGTWRVLCQSKS